MYGNQEISFSELLGQTVFSIEGAEKESGIITLTLHNGRKFRMLHYQECCEYVRLEDIIGDVEDLLHTPITLAEEVSEDNPESSEIGTWTFYKLATVKGYVTLRWLGESNGYYSESVDFEEITE